MPPYADRHLSMATVKMSNVNQQARDTSQDNQMTMQQQSELKKQAPICMKSWYQTGWYG